MTADEIAALKLKIADAESSYYSLVSGNAVRVHVDQNGERVEYAAGNRIGLYNLIQSWKAMLPSESPYNTRGPLRFTFP